MPYWLETDTFADDSVWEILAERNADLEDRLQSAYCRLKAIASRLLSNGYLMEGRALELCRGRRKVLDLLCTAPTTERAPLVHRRGDECECLGDEWVEPFAYRIHAFLKRNPSRAEVERNKAQKADLRDARLKADVYARDGGCCRYCRSGPLSPKAGRSRDRRKVLQYDHVDPDRPAGPDGEGLVVACGACNEHKGHRTPGEADMALLAKPASADKQAWAARGLAVFDRPDHQPITDGTATEQKHDAVSNTDPISDANSDDERDRDNEPTGDVHPQNADHQHEQGPAWSGKGAGSGRGAGNGDPAAPTPPRKPALTQPVRSSAEPDIYHRRSRGPTPDLPPWPPGSEIPGTWFPNEPEGENPWT